MKLTEILKEAPKFEDEDLPDHYKKNIHEHFLSFGAIERQFEIIWRGKTSLFNDQEFHANRQLYDEGIIFFNKATNIMYLGATGHYGNTDGAFLFFSVEAKWYLQLSDEFEPAHNKAFQMNLSHLDKGISEGHGLGQFLYLKLAELGYYVISDTIQYRGGKALWKKIARNLRVDGDMIVLVIDHGELRENPDGTFVTYMNSNISDDKLWSTDNTHKYTLFVLCSKKHLPQKVIDKLSTPK